MRTEPKMAKLKHVVPGHFGRCYLPCVALACVVGLIVPSSAAFAEDSATAINKPSDPDRAQEMDRDAQMTFAGGRYFVIGPIQRIKDQYFYVKDEEFGDDVRLVMDEGTRVICTVQTAGGSVRDCVLSVGDRVRAEVSALGTVTTIRALPQEEKSAYGKALRPRGAMFNLAGPTGDYIVIPVPFGSLRDLDPQGPTLVKGPHGNVLGTLHKLIMDAGSGRIICAVVRKADSDTLVAVPWADLAISRQDGAIVLLNQYSQLELPESPHTLLDRSPRLEDLNRLLQELQATIPADLKAPESRSAESNLPATAQKATCPDPYTIQGEVVRGQVVDVQDHFLIIKDSSGTLIHVHKDPCTHQASQRIRSGLFLPGDTVEAYVTPKGNAISLSMLRPASYASVPD